MLIFSIALLCACSNITKPKAVAEIQVSQSSQFGPVSVVYKSMIRALVNLSEEGMAGDIDLKFADQIERIYYYNSSSAGRSIDTLLGSRIDSMVTTDSYSELSEIVYEGKTYKAFIKNSDQLVSEILVLQQTPSEIVLISVLGEIKLEEVMKNIGQLPKLLQLTDALPL